MLNVSTLNIAWNSDKQYRFANPNSPQNFNTVPSLRGGNTIQGPTLASDERFLVRLRGRLSLPPPPRSAAEAQGASCGLV